jgi:alkanesulfonate monooxygenase SsuD/methylene tetrahydromethanopterin reductase-like flavin-dependent oxidoreductase (luciferase family)
MLGTQHRLFNHVASVDGSDAHCGAIFEALLKPIQRPHIPILVGGNGEVALRRAAGLGQGWIPLFQQPTELKPKIARLGELCAQRGRSLDDMEVVAGYRVRLGEDTASHWGADDWLETAHAYSDDGVDELSLVIVEPDLRVDQLLDKLAWFAEEVVTPLRSA